jgi:hypothetical protein
MPLLKTCGTGAGHIEPCLFNVMTIQPFFSLKMNLCYIHVIYPRAVTTEKVVMRLGVIVVMSLAAFDGYLMNKTVLLTEIEVVIDRGPR